MIKLIMVKPKEWKEGEVIRVKVLRMHQYAPGRWELVLEEVESE